MTAPTLVPGVAVRAGQLVAGKYRVEELLGSGAAGVVLAARHVHLREPVTLKLLASYTPAQDDALARRLEKARVAAGLRGDHVARTIDIGVTEQGLPYVASERFAGETLEAELEARGRLPVDEAVRWILEACAGLAEAHALGLVHGDLKPRNLFLARAGGGARVLKVLDFGMASPIEAADDATASAWFGSPAYLAPEQIQDAHHVDARADVWALGVLLYELIAGARPFTADTVSGVLVAVAFDAAPLLTDAPYDLARVVSRCLDKDPANRPSGAVELAEALAPFTADGGRLLARVRRGRPAARDDGDTEGAANEVSSSTPPVTVEIGEDGDHEPLPLVNGRGVARSRADEITRPSARMRARRRRGRARALLATAFVTATTIAAWLAARPEAPVLAATPEPTAVDRAALQVPPFVPPPEVMRVPVVAVTPAELPSAKKPPKRRPSRGRHRHRARPHRAHVRRHLPAGLPSTREPVAPPTKSRHRPASKHRRRPR